MSSKCLSALALAVVISAPAAAQDAKATIAAASKGMGMDNLTSITIYGSGANYNLGQSNNANDAWPRNNLSDYQRSIDFTASTSRATAATFAAPVTGGPAVQGAFQQNITPNNTAWPQQLEIWTTPWGCLKGAQANNATVASSGGAKTLTWMTTQKAPSGVSYKVICYIDSRNLVTRVDTWLENPIFGDMLIENDYSNYREALGGVMYPASIVQRRGGQPTFGANPRRQHESFEYRASSRRLHRPAAVAVQADLAAPPPRRRRRRQKLADGGTHHGRLHLAGNRDEGSRHPLRGRDPRTRRDRRPSSPKPNASSRTSRFATRFSRTTIRSLERAAGGRGGRHHDRDARTIRRSSRGR
jgi:hypothetical protein